MEPNEFVAEVYRRMSLRHAAASPKPTLAEIAGDLRVSQAICEYRPVLPPDKDAAILDIGFGDGWFIAACLKLGYTSVSGADFGIANKLHIADWSNSAVTLHEIKKDIGEFLSDKPERYDFIHMSHVIEHIPKYSLLWIADSLFHALKKNGVLLLRTPNMEGPTPTSSLFVTLAHEYGFCGANLISLLDICGFDEIRARELPRLSPTPKQRAGNLLRQLYLAESRVRHRLFGANRGGVFAAELIVTAKRGGAESLFHPKYR